MVTLAIHVGLSSTNAELRFVILLMYPFSANIGPSFIWIKKNPDFRVKLFQFGLSRLARSLETKENYEPIQNYDRVLIFFAVVVGFGAFGLSCLIAVKADVSPVVLYDTALILPPYTLFLGCNSEVII
uniref:Uncharacterized protein n=1 Tax=Onchocerca volvulus TaxID=6282 RepID=A0A8R1TZY4_ONCVO